MEGESRAVQPLLWSRKLGCGHVTPKVPWEPPDQAGPDAAQGTVFYFSILIPQTSIVLNLCAGTGLCGLPYSPGGLPWPPVASRGLLWPPVDDGTDNMYSSEVSSTKLGPNLIF